MKRLKTICKENKKEIIKFGTILALACVGGFIGARSGIESGFHRMKVEIFFKGSDGEIKKLTT